MAIEIMTARGAGDLDGLPDLLREFLTWDLDQLRQVSGVELSVDAYVNNSLDEIDLYMPPRGRLLLVRDGGRLLGMAFLKPIRDDTCEIKRMYVSPELRGQGLGKTLLTTLIDEARAVGYRSIMLDSAVYMDAAHGLYRSMGFTDIDYYEEGETAESLKDYLVYMALRI